MRLPVLGVHSWRKPPTLLCAVIVLLRCLSRACRERLTARVAKLEAQLAQQAERAERAEAAAAAAQEEAEEEVRSVRRDAAAQLAEARQLAAVAREQSEAATAR